MYFPHYINVYMYISFLHHILSVRRLQDSWPSSRIFRFVCLILENFVYNTKPHALHRRPEVYRQRVLGDKKQLPYPNFRVRIESYSTYVLCESSVITFIKSAVWSGGSLLELDRQTDRFFISSKMRSLHINYILMLYVFIVQYLKSLKISLNILSLSSLFF